MQTQYTKNVIPGRFELGTTLSLPKRSIHPKGPELALEEIKIPQFLSGQNA